MSQRPALGWAPGSLDVRPVWAGADLAAPGEARLLQPPRGGQLSVPRHHRGAVGCVFSASSWRPFWNKRRGLGPPLLPGRGGQPQLARAGPAIWGAQARDGALGAVPGSGVSLWKGPGHGERRELTAHNLHHAPGGPRAEGSGVGEGRGPVAGPSGARGRLGLVFAFPMRAPCRGASVTSFLRPLPPGGRWVAAEPGPSVLRPPQPAIHWAWPVHSRGLVPAVGGRPRRAGRAARPPLCPPLSPTWAVGGWCEGHAWLCVTPGANGRGSSGGRARTS